MLLQEVGFDLAHHVEHHADHDQQRGAAEELGDERAGRQSHQLAGEHRQDEDQAVRKMAPAKVRRVIVKSRKSAVGLPGRTPGM